MLDVDVNREEEKTAHALVSYRMTSFMLSATAITDARGGVSVICTSDNKSGGVAVLRQEAPECFAATAGFDAFGVVFPVNVSVGCVAATVPGDDGGAESTMLVSAPSAGKNGWLLARGG